MEEFKLNIKTPIIMEAIFIVIAVVIYMVTSNTFFIFNFLYIGSAISIGLFFMARKHRYARNIILLAVGSYLFFYIGIAGHENLSMSGFWYYLFLGVFEAAVVHFLVAKIIGPLLFGRGWCGYACWTAMVLDLLPYKTPQNPRKNWGYIRYVIFLVILCGVTSLFILKLSNLDLIIYYLFIAGNLTYYVVGIILAYKLKDNRAFCKYVCPITVFLKIFSYFSLLRVKVDEDLCVDCGKCIKSCPMDVDILDNSRKRENATECILCLNCIHSCSKDALKL
ncbi:4Fe-4S binding protein [Methanobrevibacter sp.]|uniref:4Fe-4S binding protein n=1 Tax=Methanobrevibacter sp. TaxID=66852 RepID=UPI00388E54D5